jgi:arabinofuranosyltransferase
MSFNQKYKQTAGNITLLLFSGLCLLFFIIELADYYHDDAYIILRYARNFLAGNGLVWNAGERVEGYSSFLWLIMVSMLGYFRIDLVLASQILGVAFAFATIGVFFIFERQRSILGAVLLSTNSCFALWALGGLETVAFGFFLFLGCYLFFKKIRSGPGLFYIGIIFCLATMTRPEGMLFFCITLAFIIFAGGKLSTRNFTAALFCTAGFSVLYLPYFIWRFYYYGYLFPCTFYVKGGTNFYKLLFGGQYVWDFVSMYCFPLFIFLLCVRNRKGFTTDQAYLGCLLFSYLVYVFTIGGDHMPGFRFFVPVLPLFYLYVQELYSWGNANKTSLRLSGLAVLAVLFNFYVSFSAIPRGPEETAEAMHRVSRYKHCFMCPDTAAYLGKFVGRYIKEHWPANSSVAANTAGAVPYYSERLFIDMLGLNDYTIARTERPFDYNFFFKEVLSSRLLSAKGRATLKNKLSKKYLFWELIPGHGKGNGQYVLSRKPDYIILGPVTGSATPWFLSDREILQSREFYACYEPEEARIVISSDPLYTYYYGTELGSIKFTYYKRKNTAG